MVTQGNLGLHLPHNSFDLHQQQELIYYVDNNNT